MTINPIGQVSAPPLRSFLGSSTTCPIAHLHTPDTCVDHRPVCASPTGPRPDVRGFAAPLHLASVYTRALRHWPHSPLPSAVDIRLCMDAVRFRTFLFTLPRHFHRDIRLCICKFLVPTGPSLKPRSWPQVLGDFVSIFNGSPRVAIFTDRCK